MSQPSPSSAPRPSPLPPAPARLVADGKPLVGTWAGSVADASFAGLAAPHPRGLRRRLVAKQWTYALVTAPDLFLCVALIDSGYLHSGFLGVFDRRLGRLLVDSNPVLPPFCVRVGEHPGPGLQARLGFLGKKASLVREGSALRLQIDWSGVQADVRLEGADRVQPLSTCAALGPGRFDFTEKTPGLKAHGEVRLQGRTIRLDGAWAGIDFTHGLLRHKTDWRWAFGLGTAQGHTIAFNCSDGFLDGPGPENALWVDGVPAALGPVSFGFDPKSPGTPWEVRSQDGALDLHFRPEGHRGQTVSLLGILESRYLQPFGSFSGHVTTPDGTRLAVEGLAGVTEDHTARW